MTSAAILDKYDDTQKDGRADAHISKQASGQRLKEQLTASPVPSRSGLNRLMHMGYVSAGLHVAAANLDGSSGRFCR